MTEGFGECRWVTTVTANWRSSEVFGCSSCSSLGKLALSNGITLPTPLGWEKITLSARQPLEDALY